jgi:chloramphenicol 3-O-phosphotransferase
MTFTDLEYVLMVAVAVLLWRNASVKMWAEREERRANKYANWLVGVYEKKGKIVHKDDSYFFEESK